MNFKLYKLKFQKNQYDLNIEYEKLSDLEKEKISSLDIKSSFEHEGDESYYSYILTDITQIEIYKNILNDNLIPYLCKDISKEIVDGNVNLESILEAYLDHSNYLKYDSFIYDLNIWIYDNLDLDSILDRISLNGITSLRKIEKEYLENYK
jgi:hypothetical protein